MKAESRKHEIAVFDELGLQGDFWSPRRKEKVTLSRKEKAGSSGSSIDSQPIHQHFRRYHPRVVESMVWPEVVVQGGGGGGGGGQADTSVCPRWSSMASVCFF